MFSKLMDAMFGCRHARYSFPITVRRRLRRYSNGAARGHLRRVPGLRQRISLRLAGNEDREIAGKRSRALLGYERSRVRIAEEDALFHDSVFRRHSRPKVNIPR